MYTRIGRIALYIFLILFLCQCTIKTLPEWRLIYKNDKNGVPVFGNKSYLIDAVRQGYPVRIGFGGRSASDTTISIEHIVEAHFLTITNEQEVFAQIIPIIGQSPDLEADTINMVFREGIEWSISVGTNGYSDRITFNRITNTTDGHRTKPTQVSWFVPINYFNQKSSITPLY